VSEYVRMFSEDSSLEVERRHEEETRSGENNKGGELLHGLDVREKNIEHGTSSDLLDVNQKGQNTPQIPFYASEAPPPSPPKSQAVPDLNTSKSESSVTSQDVDGKKIASQAGAVPAPIAIKKKLMRQTSRPRPAGREVAPVAGSKTGYLKQLASNLPSNVDDYLPDFVKTYAAGSSLTQSGGNPRDIVRMAEFQRVTFYVRDSNGNCRAGKESLLLLLGYSNGFQVYDVTEDSAPVQEVLSVRVPEEIWICKFVADPAIHFRPLPDSATAEQSEMQAHERRLSLLRPLLASVSTESPKKVQMYSIKTHKVIHELPFESKVLQVESNETILAVALENKIVGFHSRMLRQSFVVDCYPSPHVGVLALGKRWMAYAGAEPVVGTPADVRGCSIGAEAVTSGNGLTRNERSQSGTTEEDFKWASTVSSAAKDLAAGLLYLGEKGYQKFEERRTGASAWQKSLSETPVRVTSSSDAEGLSKDHQSQQVDTLGVKTSSSASSSYTDPVDTPLSSNVATKSKAKEHPNGMLNPLQTQGIGSVVVRDLVSNKTIANFQSHRAPLALLQFDASGSLLVSCSTDGQTVHVHRVVPRHPTEAACNATAPSHQLLYRLNRGITRAAIRHVSFSDDLRWLAATSARGTTHVFPINPTGGPVNTLTHATVAPASSTSPSSNDDGWHLRDRLASLSSSLTGTSPPRSAPSSISSSYGSVNSVQARLDAMSASSHRSKVTPKPSRVLPMVMTESLHSGCVTLSALAKVRQKLRSPLFDSLEDPGNSSSSRGNAHHHVEQDNLPVPVCSVIRGGYLCLMSSSGVLEQYELAPTSSERDLRELRLKVRPARCWDVCRRAAFPEFKPNMSTCKVFPAASKSKGLSATKVPDPAELRASWLSNVEIHTHAAPITHIWAAPQFRFMTYADDLMESNQQLGSAEQVFAERLETSPISVRGAGPTPVFGKTSPPSDNHVENSTVAGDGGQPLGFLRQAIATPAQFDNLYIPDDQEVAQHILVFDDDIEEEQTENLGRVINSTALSDAEIGTTVDDNQFDLDEEEGFILPSPSKPE